jgi:hypothetical protein
MRSHRPRQLLLLVLLVIFAVIILFSLSYFYFTAAFARLALGSLRSGVRGQHNLAFLKTKRRQPSDGNS